MSVSGIESVGFSPYVAPTVDATSATQASQRVQGPTGPSFGTLLVDGLEQLEALQDRTDTLSVKAATGDLNAIHDYTIAATETKVATQLTVALRNKAVEAFQEIMRMQVG
jgi:flagellar hook-basal body complex protein FliE